MLAGTARAGRLLAGALTLGVLAASALGQQWRSVDPEAAVWAQAPADSGKERYIAATGDAELEVAPDRARVIIGVEARAERAADAQAAAARRLQAAIDAVRRHGVPEERIQSKHVQLSPEYRYEDGERIFVGYLAVHDLEVEVVDLSRLGALLDAAVAAGADTIRGIQFELTDSEDAYQKALAEAVAIARARAEVLAEAGGLELGELIALEQRSAPPVRIFEAADVGRLMAASQAGTTIQPGQLTVRAEVAVRYAIAG